MPPQFLPPGRRVTHFDCPGSVLDGTSPISMTRAQARYHVLRLLTAKSTHHSMAGGTLWVSLYYLQWSKTPYTLTAVPGMGYSVEIKEIP